MMPGKRLVQVLDAEARAALKHRRESLGLSQRTLGTLCGVTSQAITQVETGRRQPGADLLDAMAKHLGLSVSVRVELTPAQTGDEKSRPRANGRAKRPRKRDAG